MDPGVAGREPAAPLFWLGSKATLRGSRQLVVIAALAAGCGGGSRGGGFETLRPACPEERTWNGRACVPWGGGATTLKKGETALAEGDLDEAIELFGRARAETPHRHETYLEIFEQLGKAYAFASRERQAVDAYSTLLTLSPGYLLSYHLSAKATFKFEEAREKLAKKPATSIEVSWPDELDTQAAIPLEVEVVADPLKLLDRAVLYVRRGSERRAVDLRLAPPGQRVEIEIPALGTEAPEKLALNLVGFDRAGNEVALWASPDRPRTVRVDYTPPPPWYRRWWVIASIGTGVAAAVAGGVYLAVRSPPDSFPIDFGGP